MFGKHMFGKHWGAYGLSVALALAGAAAASPPDQYRVSARIAHGDAPLANPNLVVKAGTPAEMSVSGEEEYRLAVVVTPTDTDSVEVSARVFTSLGSVQTVVVTTLGSPIAVASGDIALELTVEPGG